MAEEFLLWKELYSAAILEVDKNKLLERLNTAKMAIYDRVEELNGAGSMSERMALNRAMKALCELQDVYFTNVPNAYVAPATLKIPGRNVA